MTSEPEDVFASLDKKALKARDEFERAGSFAAESVKRLAYYVTAIAGALYLVAVLYLMAAPHLLKSGNPALVDLGVIPYIFAALTFACHQMPERSFMIVGVALPVCARCIGIYLGSAAGLLTPILSPKKSMKLNSIKTFLLAFIPIGLDGIAQSSFAATESPNILRFATGLIFGFGVVVYLTHKFFSRYPDFKKIIACKEGFAVVFIATLFITYLAYTGFTTHLNLNYVGAVKAAEIAGFEGKATAYYIPPRAPVSIRADRFAKTYDDHVISDILAMKWAENEYDAIFNYSPQNEGKPLSQRHLLGLWVLIKPTGEGDITGKIAYTNTPGEYVYLDAWTGETLEKTNH